MRPFPLLRSVLATLVCLALGSSLAHAGELKTTIVSVAQTCVGQELKLEAKIENINASFSVHSVVATTRVKQGTTVLATKTSSQFDLAPSSANTMTIATGWTPTATGNYTVEVSADGTDDINGPQIASSPFTVCSSAPCPERPTASDNVIYLGSGSSGTLTYTGAPAPCCYEIKVTIVTGRDAITSRSPENWTAVGTSTTVSVAVDRSKWNGSYVTLRVDWRKCDKSASGSDYILVRDGTAQTASATTTQPVGTTAGGTPQSGTDGDPVMTSTREFTMPVAKLDAEALAHVPVGMGRTYQSLLETVAVKDNDFGKGWTHTYDWNAIIGDGEAYVTGPGGVNIRFRQSGNVWALDWPKNAAYSFSAPDASSYLFGDASNNMVVGFHADGRLAKIGNASGYFNTVNWSGRWISSIKTPSGKGLTITRDSNGLITGLTNGVKSVGYGYANGTLAWFQDAAGNRTTYNYAPGTHYLINWTTPEGRSPFTNTYDASGRVTRQDHGDGFVIDFSFLNGRTTMTYPGGITRSHVHDDKHQLTSIVDPLSNAATINYDADGNRTSITDMEGGVTSRSYVNGLITGTTLADGGNWNIDRGNRMYQGLTMRDIEEIGMVGKPAYVIARNANGAPTSTKAPNGFETKYEYSAGPLPSRIYGFTSDFRYTYNADGLVTSRIASNGTVHTFTRNESGHITGVTIDNSTTEYRYDQNQDLTSILNGGNSERWGYDKDRQLIGYTDRDNRTWSRVLDTRGRVSEVRNPLGTGAKFTWLGPIMTSLEFGNGVKYLFEPSISGLPGKITDEGGNAWGIDYNAEGRPTKLTFPDGMSNNYSVDAMGRTSDITTPMGRRYEFKFNTSGLLDEFLMPGGIRTEATTNDTYSGGTVKTGNVTLGFESEFNGNDYASSITDGSGNVWKRDVMGSTGRTTFTAPSGKQTTINLRGWNQIESIDWGLGNRLEYQYTGRELTGVKSGQYAMTWDFSPGGLLTTMNGDPITYDGAGRVTKKNGVEATRTPSGVVSDYTFEGIKIAKYTYDERGYVSGVEDQNGGKTKVNTDERGRMTGFEFPGGFVMNYEWNSDDQIARISTSDGWGMTYTRDGNGRVTSRERTDDVPLTSVPTPQDQTMQYDQDNRLSGGTYDGFGNYTSGADSKKYIYNPLGLEGFTIEDIDYDFHTDSYGYAKQIKGGSIDYSFVYNHITDVRYPIIFNTPAGKHTNVALPNGRILYTITPQGQVTYPIDDGQGNVVAVRDASGAYTNNTLYTPFGEVAGTAGGQPILGYQGLNGWVSFLDHHIDGNNVYVPDYGRYINRVGMIGGYPFNIDPRTANLNVLGQNEYNEGPINPFSTKVGLYSQHCHYYDCDFCPPDDCREPEYVRVSEVYGSGFFYIPGTETVIRIGGYQRTDGWGNPAGDALKLGYGLYNDQFRLPDWNLGTDKKIGSLPGYQFGLGFDKPLFGLDYGYGVDVDVDDDETEPEKVRIGIDIDKIFNGLWPSYGQMLTPTPTPAPQSQNDTPTNK